MKRIHLLPNILTAFGLTCGLFVIFKMTMTPVGGADENVLKATAGLLLLAGFFDLLDGALARAMRAESEFGGVFDSLADAISFGVAPPVIVLKSLSLLPGTFLSFFVTTAALVYSVCGVLRLVRFNMMAKVVQGNEELEIANKKNFTGLPIPAAAAALVSLNLFLLFPDFMEWSQISEKTQTLVLCAAMFILGYFMISRWKFLSLKRLQIRVASFRLVFLTVLCAVFVFYGLIHHFALVFVGISWSYVILAWILSVIRMIAGKRTKALEDFEPEPDELTDD